MDFEFKFNIKDSYSLLDNLPTCGQSNLGLLISLTANF